MKEKRKLVHLSVAVVLGACLLLSARAARKALWHYQASQPRKDADAALQVGGSKRLYDLHVSSAYTGEKPTPLVLAFHGAAGDGQAMEQVTGLNQIADQEGFIVAYPDALPPRKHWDARRGSGPDTSNDVGFIAALIDELSQRYTVDRSRIYIVGLSNGGMFAQRLACELSDRVTAIAAVASAMPTNLSTTCNPTKPISVLLINGTQDDLIPPVEPGKALLSLPDTVKFWKAHNRCSAEAVRKSLPQNPHLELETYDQCANQTRVMLSTIEGGTHGWGDDPISGGDNLVKPGQEMNESAFIWSFLSQQSSEVQTSSQPQQSTTNN